MPAPPASRPPRPLRPLSPLTIAVAQPPTTTGAPADNAEAHALTVLAARARLVVFPELSLTGYDLTAPTVAVDARELDPVIEACATTGSVVLLGAPVRAASGGGASGGTPAGDAPAGAAPAERPDRSIAVVLVDGGGARVVYRKQHLGTDEARHFAPGPRPVVLDLDGWRVGVGICRDTGVGDHVKELANAGIDLYVAGLVDHPADLGIQRRRAATIARACGAYVGFASFAGPTAGGYAETAGRSAVFGREGTVLAETSALPGGIARAVLT